MQPLDADEARSIGPYRLLGRLGAGGMGRVYLGRSAGGRTVAVKIVHPHFALDEGFRARFRREVAAARKVGGAWTAPVLDADPDAPVPWVATGYVAGPSLAQAVTSSPGAATHGGGGHEAHGGGAYEVPGDESDWLPAGPVPLPEFSVRVLGAGLAEALEHVHGLGLVHRDVKPSNVLLTMDGPRLIDFGIARATDGTTSLTSTGASIGSPGYMAPEQILGTGVTGAADVFSLGAVLGYAATGRPPFPGDSSAALLYKVVHEEPELHRLSGDLLDVVARCLAKDPAARPTPREIAHRLAPQGAVRALAAGWLPGPLVAEVGRSAIRLLDLEAGTADEPPVHGGGFGREKAEARPGTEGPAGSAGAGGAGGSGETGNAAGSGGAGGAAALPGAGARPEAEGAEARSGLVGFGAVAEVGPSDGHGIPAAPPGDFAPPGVFGPPDPSYRDRTVPPAPPAAYGHAPQPWQSTPQGRAATHPPSGTSQSTPPGTPQVPPPGAPHDAPPGVPRNTPPGVPRNTPHGAAQRAPDPADAPKGKLSLTVAATATPGADGRGRRLSCTVAMAVAGALAAVMVGGAFLFNLMPGTDDGTPGAGDDRDAAAQPPPTATSSPHDGGAVPARYLGTWEGSAATESGIPDGTFELVIHQAKKGKQFATLTQSDLLGHCKDVMVLTKVGDDELVATGNGAESNPSHCSNTTHTIHLRPVGKDLQYTSDDPEAGNPRSRMSKKQTG